MYVVYVLLLFSVFYLAAFVLFVVLLFLHRKITKINKIFQFPFSNVFFYLDTIFMFFIGFLPFIYCERCIISNILNLGTFSCFSCLMWTIVVIVEVVSRLRKIWGESCVIKLCLVSFGILWMDCIIPFMLFHVWFHPCARLL